MAQKSATSLFARLGSTGVVLHAQKLPAMACRKTCCCLGVGSTSAFSANLAIIVLVATPSGSVLTANNQVAKDLAFQNLGPTELLTASLALPISKPASGVKDALINSKGNATRNSCNVAYEVVKQKTQAEGKNSRTAR